jgi:hypothetical protein
MRIRNVSAALALSLFVWSSPAFAQQRHVVSPAEMRQAVAGQAKIDQQNREAVVNVLKRTQVSAVASRLGLNVANADTAVATLNSVDLAQAADAARQAEAQLAGGSNTVIISTTTLLLILIIVLLVAD